MRTLHVSVVASDLRARLDPRATVVTESDRDAYAQARRQFAFYEGSVTEAEERIAPSWIVTPACETDVSTVIRFAAEHGFVLASRSGGHQYSGLSSCTRELSPSLQIDLSRFAYVRIPDEADANVDRHRADPPRTLPVVLGAGARINEVYRLLHKYNLVMPGGVCKDVGIGGHLQTGAVGIFSRSYGLGIDQVRRVRIALADDGRIVDATPDQHEDLYWAVLGGSPGSFGTVLEYEIEAINSLCAPHAFAAQYAWEYTEEVFREVMAHKARIMRSRAYLKLRDFSTYITVVPDVYNPFLVDEGDAPRRHHVVVLVAWSGVDSGSIHGAIPREYLDAGTVEGVTFYDHFIAPFKQRPPLEMDKLSFEFEYDPRATENHGLSWSTAALTAAVAVGLLASAWDDLLKGFQHSEPEKDALRASALARARSGGVDPARAQGRYAVTAKFTVDAPIDEDFTAACVERIRALQEHPEVWCVLQIVTLGGQIERNHGLNAYPHRSAQWGYDCWALWRDSHDDRVVAAARAWLADTDARLSPRLGPGQKKLMHCTNGSLDVRDPAVQEAFYPSPGFYQKLRRVKSRYDANDRFRNRFTVPPLAGAETVARRFREIPCQRGTHSVVERLIESAARNPDKPYLTWIDDDGTPRAPLTFGQLEQDVRRHARWLRDGLGVAKGDLIALCFMPGPEFIEAFVSCLAIGAVPVPIYPFHPGVKDHAYETCRHILDDCAPRYILTDSFIEREQLLHAFDAADADLARRFEPLRRQEPPLEALTRSADDAVAFVQYTSGTTARPRGVRITHRNLLRQLEANRDVLGVDEDTRGLVWVPQYHDFGLISALLSALIGNFLLYMMSPAAFLRRPHLWFEAIDRVRATHTCAPNRGFGIVTQRTTPEQRARWDLSCVKVLMSAAEPVHHETMEAFFAAFESTKLDRAAFCPAYGLAENTVGVTLFGRRVLWLAFDALTRAEVTPVAAGEGVPFYGLGALHEDFPVRIVRDGRALAAGELGEIWVHGPSRGAGYVGPHAADTFAGALAGEPPGWLQTGDLGFVWENELFFVARTAELLRDGARVIPPQPLEDRCVALDALVRRGGVAALAGDATGAGAVTTLLVELTESAPSEIRTRALVEAITAVMAAEFELRVEVALAVRGAILKTTSGKVQRVATARALREGALDDRILWRARVSVASAALAPASAP